MNNKDIDNNEDAWNDIHGGFLDPGTNFLAKEWLMKGYRKKKTGNMGGNMARKGGTNRKAALVIDFPAADETIWSGHYAVRMNAIAPEGVEIRLDDGPWLPCRNEAGHWWYDLYDLPDGRHELAARPVNAGETGIAVRKFKVSRQ